MNKYQPYPDTIYLMTGYLVSDADEPRYPQFDIFINENIFFHTLVEAEAKIAELVEDKELAEQRACFFVYEIPLGVNCDQTQGQEIRSYTADGKLNSQSKVSADSLLEIKFLYFGEITFLLKRYMLFLLTWLL